MEGVDVLANGASNGSGGNGSAWALRIAPIAISVVLTVGTIGASHGINSTRIVESARRIAILEEGNAKASGDRARITELLRRVALLEDDARAIRKEFAAHRDIGYHAVAGIRLDSLEGSVDDLKNRLGRLEK